MRAPTLTFKRARRLRREMSLPEVVLWGRLRRAALYGLTFRRQHPIGPYIVDFFCAKARLAIEIDGAEHNHPGQVKHDLRRDAWLGEQGVRVLRFAASDVLDDERLEGVLETIAAAAPPPPPAAVPLPRAAGEEH